MGNLAETPAKLSLLSGLSKSRAYSLSVQPTAQTEDCAAAEASRDSPLGQLRKSQKQCYGESSTPRGGLCIGTGWFAPYVDIQPPVVCSSVRHGRV